MLSTLEPTPPVNFVGETEPDPIWHELGLTWAYAIIVEPIHFSCRTFLKATVQ